MLDHEATSESSQTAHDTNEFIPGTGPASIIDEIRGVEFPIARRGGYDQESVEAYVARVADLVMDLEATRSPEYAVERALNSVGEETAGILRQAQETARQMTVRSQAQAHERLDHAEREANRLREEAEAHVRRLEQEVERMGEERRRLIDDTRRLAEAVLRAADDAQERIPSDRAASPVPAAVPPGIADPEEWPKPAVFDHRVEPPLDPPDLKVGLSQVQPG